MNKQINFIAQANPKAAYLSDKEQIDKAIQDVLNNGFYILGQQVSSFEKNFAQFIGVDYAIAVANGTDAIELGLRGLGAGNGDAVFTVSHTAVATVSAIERAGAVPVLVDVDPTTYTMDPTSLEEAIEEELKLGIRKPFAIVAVHLYGHPADIIKIQSIAKKYNLKLVEDCAQAHGAQFNGHNVGTFGDLATFSFYPTKNLGAFGDGGAIVTNNKTFSEMIKALREYGWTERYVSTYAGINSRLDEIQAAVLNVRLKKLNEDNERRRQIASEYTRVLSGTSFLKCPVEVSDCKHVYHLYVINTEKRDSLKQYLYDNQIGTAIHYPFPVHLQPGYNSRIPVSPRGLPATESVVKRILSLPMYPQLTDNEVEYILKVLSNWVKNQDKQ